MSPLTNSVDPDEMPYYAAFIWVFSVCKSTHLGVSHIQKSKDCVGLDKK